MKIVFSIIIPTYKRENSLLRLLISLVPEMKPDYEIIIVEQLNNNEKMFTDFAGKHNIHLTYIFLEQPSTPHAKNIGAATAKGKYLIFFDDDVVVKKGIMDGYTHAFMKDKRDIVAGRVLTPGHPVFPESRNVGKISYWGKFSDDYSSLISQEVDTVLGCNAGWKKSVFMSVGGFDEQITMNGIREESDLSLRAKEKGYTIIFEPSAEVTHLREETGGGRKSEGRLWWYYNFFSNETYFFLKHRPKIIACFILLSRWQWFLRSMFGFGREVSIRSLLTPLTGVLYGIQKYRKYRRDYR